MPDKPHAPDLPAGIVITAGLHPATDKPVVTVETSSDNVVRVVRPKRVKQHP